MTSSLQDPKQLASLRSKDKRIKEMRRKVLEVLSSPDVANIASKFYTGRLKKANARLGYEELKGVLKDLEKQLGITFPTKAEKLFKRFDINADGSLDLNEFYELFISSLRRCAFDNSLLVGREIFLTREPGHVWDVFEQGKKIGSGTFGSAYLSKNRKTKEDRVVKAVKKTRAQLPVEDIEREIMVMQQTDHPHIVRLFRWFEDSHYIYLVMEALKGGTLCEVLQQFQSKNKPLKEEWTRKVMGQCMDAMGYVHSLRLIHKDLKDENIMLLKKDPDFEQPHAVIIDLGIAEMFSKADPTGKIVGGTPVTMAPEVWKGDFGPKCDVFSLGCILFELLTGRFPFEAPSIDPKEWLALHKRGPDWSLVRTSPQGAALCQLMLTYRDSERPSMADCLKHQWFEVSRKNLRKLEAAKLAPLQKFAEANSLKQAVMLEIASRLPMEHAHRIVETFKSFDTNSDAIVSFEELREAFKKLGILDEALLGSTYRAMDVDGDGVLSFTEFSMGCLMMFQDLMDDRFHALFKENDKDNDGYLQLDEAEKFLGNALNVAEKKSKKSGKDILKQMFPDKKKKLSYKELKDKILGAP